MVLKITVARYEAYPAEVPTGIVVGFAIRCLDYLVSTYMEAVVPYSEELSSTNAILDAAWAMLAARVEAWEQGNCNQVIGTEYQPPASSSDASANVVTSS